MSLSHALQIRSQHHVSQVVAAQLAQLAHLGSSLAVSLSRTSLCKAEFLFIGHRGAPGPDAVSRRPRDCIPRLSFHRSWFSCQDSDLLWVELRRREWGRGRRRDKDAVGMRESRKKGE